MRIGTDLGGTKIQGVVLGEDGEVLHSRRAATPIGGYPQTFAALVSLVAELERAAGAGEFVIGIGTPGVWQPARHAMKNYNSTWLNGQLLLDDLTERIGQRVRIANDADCFALSEASTGAAGGHSSVFGAILGTGVGGSLVINGMLISGPNGLTGEWGHIPLPYLGLNGIGVFAAESSDTLQGQIEPNGLESRVRLRECYCGRQGCTETYLSGPGLQRTHWEVWGEDCTAESIASGSDVGRN
jgi:fructokinase